LARPPHSSAHIFSFGANKPAANRFEDSDFDAPDLLGKNVMLDGQFDQPSMGACM